MASTSHERATQYVANRAMIDHPEWRDVAYEVLGCMRDGDYPQSLVDVIVQKSVGHSFDIYDAFCMAKFLLLMDRGELAIVVVPMGRGPFPDAQEDENNAVLARLPALFTASVASGNADQDGWIEWNRPVKAIDGQELPPGRAPLEIGTTKASRSLLHIQMDRSLARWPYGYDECHILLNLAADHG
jgi:hypothetical protein